MTQRRHGAAIPAFRPHPHGRARDSTRPWDFLPLKIFYGPKARLNNIEEAYRLLWSKYFKKLEKLEYI